MEKFNSYFSDVELDTAYQIPAEAAEKIGHRIHIRSRNFKPDYFRNYHLALLGVPEDRYRKNEASAQAPDNIRQQLYRLMLPHKSLKIIDLGNLFRGETIKDTIVGLSDVLFEIIKAGTIPIILGGSRQLSFAVYLAYEKLKKTISIVEIDSKINLKLGEEVLYAREAINSIILHNSKHLLNYTNLGYQGHFVAESTLELMKKLLFDAYRLGELRANMQETEPLLRDADVLSFNINAIKQADAPAYAEPSPNGFFADEACQMAKYAGISNKLTAFGIYELNPDYDRNEQTAALAAQIIWYFINGFYLRKNDYPQASLQECIKYHVDSEILPEKLIFYKSRLSGRWWVEVPAGMNDKKYVLSCSYADYQKACENKIPDRWWNFFNKNTEY